MAANTLQSLATTTGLAELAKQLSGVDSFYNEGERSAPAIQDLLRQEFQADPSLQELTLKATPGYPGGYFPAKDAIALGVLNPAVIAHELGHAKNIRKSRIYGKILGVATDAARVNNTAAIPAMLTLRTFIKDPALRSEILNILSGISAAVNAPGLNEEMSASVDAMRFTPDKLQALKTLIPAYLQHMAHATLPALVYQAGKYL